MKYDPATANAAVTQHAAQLLMSKGHLSEAVGAFRAFLERVPDHLQALESLGNLLRRLGRPAEASEVMAQAAVVESRQHGVPTQDQTAVADFFAAASGHIDSQTETAPATYVAALFDRNADRFESLLRDSLEYRAPEILLAAFQRVSVNQELSQLDILDLGCGTGLVGELFRPAARRLDGVDLSTKMLELAAAKGIYDHLHAEEIVAYLRSCEVRYHLILSADVFIYLGDLAPVLMAAKAALAPGGWLAFSVETCDGDRYVLQQVRRYAHSRHYIEQQAELIGYRVALLEETTTRIESFQPVRSLVVVLQDVAMDL